MDLSHRDPRWLGYLFSCPSRAELRAWVRRLRYFRFCKALGGHANDGDHLLVALRYTDAADLRQLFGQLGLPVVAGEELPASPYRTTLAGQITFVVVRSQPEQRLEISVADLANLYEVTSLAVATAETLEKLLAAQEARIIDPPVLDYHCVCPLYYPELWAD